MTDIALPAAAKAKPRADESDLVKQRVRAAMWFLLPMLLALAVVAAWPLARSMYFSLTNASLTHLADAKFVWFNNYLHWTVLKSGRILWSGVLVDPAWWNAVWNTLRFAVLSVAIETVFGTIVALVLNAEFPGRGIVRAAVLIPWAIPTIVSAKMWGWMFNDQFGMINDLLMNMGIIHDKIAWTASADTAFFAIIIVDVWKTTPFMALLILAGLQFIPQELYEAASVDGSNRFQQFWTITLPLLAGPLIIALLFRTLASLGVFDLFYILAGNQVQTIASYSYNFMFTRSTFDFAPGVTASIVLFILGLIVSLLYVFLMRITRR